MPVEAGTRFAQYEVRSLLGVGGMGEVYLAHDTRLNRPVALKFLPNEFTRDADRLRRFEQEACAASALNHPNIITIHEIEQTNDGSHFIITEFIDGETLRQRMTQGRMTMGEILDVATQVTGALSAAHEAGIIHRDIKPENIMIRRDRYVKVLDFGLAKLAGRVTKSGGAETAQTLLVTDPNVVMGTVAYMSPEQARGLKIDERTDIWSLGVVLYEMIAGQLPFKGSTISEALVSVLEKEPVELASLAPDVPAEFERIVKKTLCKKRDERYRSIQELQVDLQNLKRNIDFGTEIDRSIEPTVRIDTQDSKDDLKVMPTGKARGGTGEVATARMTAVLDAATEAKPLKRRTIPTLAIIGAVVAVAALALLASVAAYRYFIVDSTKPISSIAILPFNNASNDPNSEYLADGITEGIINDLSQLPGLTVIARSSVFRYKGQEVDPRAVASELGVEAVLMGRVIQRGDSLQISAELVDTRNNRQLWGEQYNRKLSDLFALQGDITHQISSKLRLKLSGKDRQRMMRRRRVNPDAYELYLKGRYFWNKRTEEDLKKGIDYFNQAIAVDPNYAQAYAGLADCYALGGLSLPPSEALPRAREAAMKALELDDMIAEAHTSLGFVRYRLDWDWAGAEQEYRRAIELNSNYAAAHHWYGVYLLAMGRLDEAMTEARRAQQLDPLSPTNNVEIGRVLYFERQYDGAIEQLKKSLEMDQNFVSTHIRLGQAYEQKGMYREAIMHLQKAVELSNSAPETVAALAHAFASSNNRAEAQKQLDKLKEMAKRRNVASYDIAVVYAGLGNEEQAFEWLKNAVEDRSISLIGIKLEPMLDKLRADPRFKEIMKRIGLEP